MSAATSFYSAAAASLQSSSADCGSSSGIGSSLAAFSYSSFSSFSSSRSPLSDTERSIGASSTSVCGGQEDADWCLPQEAETRRTRGGRGRYRRARRRGGGQRQPLDRVPVNRGGPSAAKNTQKNDREKESVKNLREAYEALGAVVRVERGPSGHFSKVRTLAPPSAISESCKR